jgi:hypothetical protein
MGQFDTIFDGKADTFLDVYGRTVAVNYVTPGVYTPSTNTSTAGSVVQTETIASPILRYSDNLVNDTTIKSGDAMIIVAPEELTRALVVQQDTFEIDGETWAIIRDLKVSSGELIAMYKYHIRVRS